jgi:hypothetical protein
MNQTLEDMLCMYVMDQQKSWEELLLLVEFSYNNRYQRTIKMVPFEFIGSKKCKTDRRAMLMCIMLTIVTKLTIESSYG